MTKKQKVTIGFIIIAILSAITYKYMLNRTQDVHVQLNEKKIQIVASFYPMYFITQEIVGDKGDVISVIPTGIEPHEYEPTARQWAEIEEADMLVLNGGGLEGWEEKIKENINTQKTKIIVASDGFKQNTIVDENGEKISDPHYWLSPTLVKKMSVAIIEGLKDADPNNAVYYTERGNAFISKITDLDKRYSEELNHCARRDFIASHAAFGYIAEAYNLRQIPIAGLSPEAEPSPKELAWISDFAKTHGITHIFFESLVSPKLANTLAQEINAKTLVLNPIEGLTEEELAGGKTYLTEMESNLTNLKIALGCNNE